MHLKTSAKQEGSMSRGVNIVKNVKILSIVIICVEL